MTSKKNSSQPALDETTTDITPIEASIGHEWIKSVNMQQPNFGELTISFTTLHRGQVYIHIKRQLTAVKTSDHFNCPMYLFDKMIKCLLLETMLDQYLVRKEQILNCQSTQEPLFSDDDVVIKRININNSLYLAGFELKRDINKKIFRLQISVNEIPFLIFKIKQFQQTYTSKCPHIDYIGTDWAIDYACPPHCECFTPEGKKKYDDKLKEVEMLKTNKL